MRTVYQYVGILQNDKVQYNSLQLLRRIDILCRAVYCSVLYVLCELELDHWNVDVDKLLFLYENLRQLYNLLVVLRVAEHILALPVTGLIIATSVLQYSNIL